MATPLWADRCAVLLRAVALLSSSCPGDSLGDDLATEAVDIPLTPVRVRSPPALDVVPMGATNAPVTGSAAAIGFVTGARGNDSTRMGVVSLAGRTTVIVELGRNKTATTRATITPSTPSPPIPMVIDRRT